jgi:hypothetical protein
MTDMYKSEQGSSTVMLVGVWMVIMGMLAMTFDFAMYYVHRQQLQTAAEAAAAAGAMQVRYKMTLRIQRRERYLAQVCMVPVPNQPCHTFEDFWTWSNISDYKPTGWEQDVWTPISWGKNRKELWEHFPLNCDPSSFTSSYVDCYSKAVAQCWLAPYGDIDGAMKQAYETNLPDVLRPNTSRLFTHRFESGQKEFFTKAEIESHMPTMFLKLFSDNFRNLEMKAVATAKYYRTGALATVCKP